MGDLVDIDELKEFLPIEMQRLIPAAPMEIDSPIVVDWKDLERATFNAWEWIINELVSTARSEGYHDFLESRRPEVRCVSHDLSQFD